MIRGGRRVVECLRFEFEQVLYKNSSPEKESTRQPRALGNPLDGTADEKKSQRNFRRAENTMLHVGPLEKKLAE